MNVTVVGGGPAGLYASALLKREFPDWQLTVYERDPADNTYGWGVVFSDATLGNLREADPVSHERISDSFVRWDPIDIYCRDEYFRCGGNTFAGIMRAELLGILQDRCRDVGVEINHETTVDDPAEVRADADLLIGADGLNSTVRETFADAFRPNVAEGRAKFAWFGTAKPFDVFTFVFRENEHGLWRVHAYPGEFSTFIVECTEATWRAADLDDRDEADALAYFEDLFADHLGSYDLRSKLYQWRNFPVVSCGDWSIGDEVVLLGDAAHTAHFSIGSGTKLAMEDAIALMEGFREHGADVRSALNWYEKERRPRVQALQDAAERSQRYFENVERYWHFEPRQFAYNLLTRSGRISYQSLKRRDPSFADAYDRWFERRVVAEREADPIAANPPLAQPLDLGDVRVANRLVRSRPPADAATDGTPTGSYLERLEGLALGDPGLVLTDPVAVSPEGRISPGTPGLYDDDHIDAWSAALDGLSARSGAAMGVHLFHAGRRASMRPRDRRLDAPLPPEEGWEPLGPSSKPYLPGGPAPRAMDEADCERVEGAFARAASRAAACGFDHLQLHCGHGYLLSSFLSPLTNDRDDDLGGDPEARARFPMRVLRAVRDAWPAGKPLGVTLQATDWNLNGLRTAESIEFARRLGDGPCDLLSVVAGQATVRERPRYDPTVLADLAETFRNETGLPVMSTNYVRTYDAVNTLVGAGRADLCLFSPPDGR